MKTKPLDSRIDFRSLKTFLGMEILRGHRADVVLKEIAMHLVTYNLIRLLMWHAAGRHGRDLHRLSFTGTLRPLHAALRLLLLGRTSRDSVTAFLDALLAWIAADLVPNRPNRSEPRCKKRRP